MYVNVGGMWLIGQDLNLNRLKLDLNLKRTDYALNKGRPDQGPNS